MQKKRLMSVGAYVAATALLVAGVVVLVRERQSDAAAPERTAASELPVLAPMPFPTGLAPTGSSQGVIGTQFRLAATSFSDAPLARVDLYDGARRVATGVPTTEGSATVGLTYPALSVGSHALHVQATDEKGRVSRSPSATVNVAVAPGPGSVVPVADKLDPPDPSSSPAPAAEQPPVQVPVVPEEEETGEELAERFAVDPSQLALMIEQDGATVDLPDFDPALPIPAGAQAVISVAPDAGLAALKGDEVVVEAPSSSGSAADPAATMDLTAVADGCDVVLTSSGGDGAVSYFDGTTSVPGWASVGETPGDGDLRITAPSPGMRAYFARTEDRTSQTVSVKVPLSCAGDLGWTGTAKIVDGYLYLPPAAAGQVYLYLQVDGTTGVRIPVDAQRAGMAFSANAVTDIRSYLPDITALKGSSAELSVMRGGEFPVEVATGSLQVPEGRSLVEIIGEPGVIDLRSDLPQDPSIISSPTAVFLDHEDEVVTMRWDAASSRVDEVLWQVVSASNDAPDFTEPTVLAAGISDASPGKDGIGTQGSFTVDTASIPGHDPAETPAGTTGKVTLLEPAITPSTVLSLKKPKSATLVAPGAALDPANQKLAVLPGPGERIFVRVTANPKGPSMGTSSNTVSIRLPTPEAPESVSGGVTMEVDSFTLDPGRAPSADYVGCAEVTLPNFYGDRVLDKDRPQNAAHLYYTSGSGIYCYVPPPPDSDECDLDFLGSVGDLACDAAEVFSQIEGAIVDLFTAAYDIGSQIYNGTIETLVKVVADFNPVCIALGQASEDAAAACVETTAGLANAVISSALASFGLPPRLPSVEELKALASGELAALAVALMKQAGVPCDALKASPEVTSALDAAGGKAGGLDVATVAADPCLAVARGMVGQATKLLTTTMSNETAAATNLRTYNITGFSLKPVPQSLPQPMQVELTMHPADPDLDVTGLACSVSVAPTAPALSKYQGDPAPFRGVQLLQVHEDGPVDGKGSFSGSAVFSEYGVHPYPGVAPLSTRLKDLDMTFTFDQGTVDEVRSRKVIHYYDACLGAQGSVTERVRPPDA